MRAWGGVQIPRSSTRVGRPPPNRHDDWCSSVQVLFRDRPSPSLDPTTKHPGPGTDEVVCCRWQHGPPGETMSSMLAAFSITPLGAGESVGDLVAEAVRIVRASGLPNETNAMFTNVEGEWDEVMALIKACVMKVAEEAPRVSVVIKIDHRPGVSDGLHSKVEAVEDRLRGDAGSLAASRDQVCRLMG